MGAASPVALFACDEVASSSREESSIPNQKYSEERPRSFGAIGLIGSCGCDCLFKGEFNATLVGQAFAARWDNCPLLRDFVFEEDANRPLV